MPGARDRPNLSQFPIWCATCAKPFKPVFLVAEKTASSGDPGEEIRLRGTPAAAGIAHAGALVHWLEEEEIPLRAIESAEIPSEIARFEAALAATRADLLEIQKRVAASIGTEDASIFDAHLLVVEDRTLIDEVLRHLEKNHINIESAFHQVVEKYCKSLSQIDDPYLRERTVDVEDVAKRILRNLLGKSTRQLATHDRPHILVARELTPSDTALMNRSLVLGFATEAGSKTSHTAIMARALGIPAVVGVPDLVARITTGDDLLVDGYEGFVILNPSAATLEEYGRIELQKEAVEEKLELIRDTESTTSDGRHIVLSANIELPEEIEDVAECGARGVGLYRTEFLFLNRDELPSEEEQYATYRLLTEKVGPESVIIRTLDIGGDKEATAIDLPSEENPFLGCRALRLCLAHPALFKTQLRAILRASAHGNVKILLPMVSGIEEVRRVKEILGECREGLAREGAPCPEKIEIGAMIEIPSAALSARWLAKEVDFFSIGTNDLIQYTIAVDRVNDRVAHLYSPTHPAILRLIKETADAAHEAGIWAGVCGEMAGEIALTPLLVGLGLDELSTSPGLVPRVKKAIQSLAYSECAELVERALQTAEIEEIARLSESLAKARYAELF